jgi:hypothetical protein
MHMYEVCVVVLIIIIIIITIIITIINTILFSQYHPCRVCCVLTHYVGYVSFIARDVSEGVYTAICV